MVKKNLPHYNQSILELPIKISDKIFSYFIQLCEKNQRNMKHNYRENKPNFNYFGRA